MIAQDKEIVKVILLLTGSIQGTKNKINDFISKFHKFEWLWKKSISKSIKDFAKGSKIVYYPIGKRAYGPCCGEQAWREFECACQDESNCCW